MARDTPGRDAYAAKKVPKKKKSKPFVSTPESRSFAAHTAIFVPPELQHEHGPKPKPVPRKSVVFKDPPKRTESHTEKRKRLAAETAQRERYMLGLKLTGPTGKNDLRGVPAYVPKRHHATVDLPFGQKLTMWKPLHDIGLGLGLAAKALPGKAYRELEEWGGELADVPGNVAAALLNQSPAAPRGSPIPQGLAKAGRALGEAEPVVRPIGKTAAFIGSEKGQEEIWGKSLVNLVAHGDTPGTGMEAAGMGVGILGILPFGKITQLAKLGKAARAAGKIGEALPMTEARQATYAAMAQRLGTERADNLILMTDNIARQSAASKADEVADIVEPDDWYQKNPITAENWGDFTPGGETIRFQTGAGIRQGLVEGGYPGSIQLGKRAAFKEVNGGGGVVLFDTFEGDTAMMHKEGGSFHMTVWKDAEPDAPTSHVVSMDEARAILKQGTNHHMTDFTPSEVPVFYSELMRQVEKQVPERGLTKEETASKLQAAVKPSEWSDTGMQDFIDSYPDGARIPRDDIQQHLSVSLNAYDLDEVIRVSGDPKFPDAWGPGNTIYSGRLTVRDPTPDEPYVEIAMRLRTPMHTRTKKGVFDTHEVMAPYIGKGRDHWAEDDVIGHVRFHIIIDADGKKALVVDEIQSDWASEWRKVKGDWAGAQDEIDAIRPQMERLEQEMYALEDAGMDGGQEYLQIEEELNALHEAMEKHSIAASMPGPPPLGQKQMEALVRRTLRYAHDADVDRIIIVGGDVQALRNNAYKILPSGEAMQLGEEVPHSIQNEQMQKWFEQVKDMSHDELKAYLNDPVHADTPMVKTFRRLYGEEGKAGDIPVIFEKEMGVKGSHKEGAFEGGYSDQMNSVRRSGDPRLSIDGVQYRFDPNVSYGQHVRPKEGDIVTSYHGIGKLFRGPNGSQPAGLADVIVELKDGTKRTMKLRDLQRLVPDEKVWPGHTAMDGYVIEMTPEAHAKAAVPMAYYQQRAWEGIPKGATEFFEDGRRAIRLFEGADVSTVIHELAHVGLADMNEVDRAIILRHFNGLRTTADHEMYARSLERYVYDGMAMKSELDGVFGKLKVWMNGIYQHVNTIGAVVNPEVKQVFDRMLVKQESPAEQLVRLLKSAPPVRKAQAAGYSEERSRRIAEMMEAWNEEGGVDRFRQAMHTLKGELPKEAFTGLDELPPEALEHLVKAIRASTKVRGYEKVRAASAVIKATEGGVPTDSELALLNKIFGGEVGFNKVRKNGIDRILVEIWNIPRSLSATLDLSAPLRQGLIAGARHPVLFGKNFAPMFKAAYRAKYAEDVAEDIATRPNASLYQRAKLAVETSASDPSFANREEAFYSSYADKFPVIKQSSRAYETFLHKMRADVFDHMVAAARKKGIDVESEKFLLGAGKYVNSITGRGVMPETELFPFEQAAPFFNTLFFSPRLLASRLNMISPVYYYKLWKHDPFIAKQAMRAMLHTVTGAVTTLAIADQMPGVDVGLDPTSANFGKIRIGDTRVDVLAGFGPLMVLVARLSLGYSTSSTTGKRQDLKGGFGESSRKDILYRFGESKFAPTTGILRDVLGGQNFIGEPVTWQSELKNNAIPMMARDAWEVGHEPSDPTEALVAASMVVVLGGLGIGFSSYPDKAAKSEGGSSEPTSELPEGWEDGGSGGGAPEGWDEDQGGGLPEGW